MPIEVDEASRLDQIAEATLRVAERDGPNEITIRSVAAELGRSTTVITNYVPTRSDLLLNVINYTQRQWDLEVNEETQGLEGASLARAIGLWSCTTRNHDHAVRSLWLGLAGRMEAGSAPHAALREDAQVHYERLREVLADADVDQPALNADLLYLVLRGYYFAEVEDPEIWNEARVSKAVSRLLVLLLGPDPDAES